MMLCGCSIALCVLNMTLGGFDITLCGFDLKFCGCVVLFCGFDMMLCGICITFCGLFMTLCGFIIHCVVLTFYHVILSLRFLVSSLCYGSALLLKGVAAFGYGSILGCYAVKLLYNVRKTLRYAVSLIHCSSLTKHRVVLLHAHFISLLRIDFYFLKWNRYFVRSFFYDVMWTNPSMTYVL